VISRDPEIRPSAWAVHAASTSRRNTSTADSSPEPRSTSSSSTGVAPNRTAYSGTPNEPRVGGRVTPGAPGATTTRAAPSDVDTGTTTDRAWAAERPAVTGPGSVPHSTRPEGSGGSGTPGSAAGAVEMRPASIP